MPLTVKTFLDKDSRDREYYELAKKHFDVMRYGDQEEGALVQGADGKVTRQPGQMIWCIAHGSLIKKETVVIHDMMELVPQRADSGIELGVVEGPSV